MDARFDASLQHHDVDYQPQEGEPRILDLDPNAYPGGIAIWGALPTVYDTSICPPDHGVHVHARMAVGGKKSIDETFDVVQVHVTTQGSLNSFAINGSDSSNYNISTILKRQVTYLRCPSCDHVHSDTGELAVTPHCDHQCEKCGSMFSGGVPSISNPVMLLKELCGDVLQDRPIKDPVKRTIRIQQQKYSGGIQLWGSNPAIIWTSPKPEEGGIHFHGFHSRVATPSVDETFGTVDVDGLRLDPEAVRHLMAQQALEHLIPHLVALDCPQCGQPHFDRFDLATRPHPRHTCERCQAQFDSPEACALTVSNPMIRSVAYLAHRFREYFPETGVSPRFPWEAVLPSESTVIP